MNDLPAVTPPNDLQERKFCEVLLADPERNEVSAYLSVWPDHTKRMAVARCKKMLKPEHPVGAFVEAELERVRASLLPQLNVTEATVIQEIAKPAFFNPKNLYDENGVMKHIIDMDDATAASIAEVTERIVNSGPEETVLERKYKMVDKTKNLELLGRYLKLFTDRVETNQIPVMFNLDLGNKND